MGDADFGRPLEGIRFIFIVPKELDAGVARKVLMGKRIFSTQEFLHVAGPHAFTQDTGVAGGNSRAKEIKEKSPSNFHLKERTSCHSFYGFSENPFNVTPDPKFLYLTHGHRDALVAMIEGIENPKGLISITGEPGTGKTSLIHYFLGSLDEKVKTAFIFHTLVSFTELLKNILLELGLETTQEEERALVSQLQGYLHRLARDETVVLVIDEAQSLQEGVIEGVGKLSDLEGRLQIIFVGQPEFEGKICSERLKLVNQKITVKRQITALNKEQSARYVDHRLKQAGSRSDEVFTPRAISLITRYSRGIPRTINILCDNALQVGYTLFRERVDEGIILTAMKYMEGPQRGISNRLATIVRELRLKRLSRTQVTIAVSLGLLVALTGLTLFPYRYDSMKKGPTSKAPKEVVRQTSTEPTEVENLKEKETIGVAPLETKETRSLQGLSRDANSPPGEGLVGVKGLRTSKEATTGRPKARDQKAPVSEMPTVVRSQGLMGSLSEERGPLKMEKISNGGEKPASGDTGGGTTLEPEFTTRALDRETLGQAVEEVDPGRAIDWLIERRSEKKE